MISTELDALRTAAERDDRIAAMKAIEHLDEAFERDRLESQRFDTMAALLDQPIDDLSDDTRNEYREAVVELGRRRIELDRSILAYVQAEDSSATLVEAVDAVDVAYRVHKERATALETTVSDVSLPPMVLVQGNADIKVPKGTTVDAELALSVIGDSHFHSTIVDVESKIPASVSPSVAGSLDENETTTVHVELSPTIDGEFDVVVTATGKTNVDRFQFTALVLTKRDYVDGASRITESLETTFDSMGEGRGHGLGNQARTLRRRLELISDDLEDRRKPMRSIDNRLNAVRNSAEAMERQLSHFESSVKRQESLYILENIIDEIDGAIEASS